MTEPSWIYYRDALAQLRDQLRDYIDQNLTPADGEGFTECKHLRHRLVEMLADESSGPAAVRAEQAEQIAEFKRIGQGFQQDAQKYFEQSCLNLNRAEAAERTVVAQAQQINDLRQTLDAFTPLTPAHKFILTAQAEEIARLRAALLEVCENAYVSVQVGVVTDWRCTACRAGREMQDHTAYCQIGRAERVLRQRALKETP